MYLRAHQRAGTRALHYLATAVGISGAVAALATGIFWLFLLGIAMGYVIAVLCLDHRGNQPLILDNPFWGAVSDVRMLPGVDRPARGGSIAPGLGAGSPWR
jgi:hypothetical protein